VSVLEKLGFGVSCPAAQTCCGQPMFNAGYFDQSREVARYFLETFGNTNTLIIAPSSSCAAMVRKHYPKLFENEPEWLEKAQQVANRTYEFCEFLTKKLNIDLAGLNARFNGSVTFHRSCHYRELEITDEPISLIKQIAGIKYVPLENIEQCCGFGGTFSVKFPHISEGMVREKVQAIKKTNADWVIFGDAGCVMNITGYASRIGEPIKAMHIAELIDNSMRS
jgi:L-lactate dehydrogenase complex protein LldE